MNLTGVLDSINKPNALPGDYTGEDGLLYCGKCHTPKQTRGSGPLSGKLLSIPCKCREKEIKTENEREVRKKVEELRAHCLPVKAMHKHTFEVASEAKHIRIAKRYVEEWPKMRRCNVGLLLWGNTGTGKSFTAHCVANALIDQGIPVRIYSVVDLIAQLMDWQKRDDILQRIRTVPLLILDDVGAERDTPFSREQLCAIIDERGESGMPLVVTTNYAVSDMENCTDPEMQRIFDRLCAMCIKIAVTGKSRRKEIGAQKLRDARALLEGSAGH